MPGGADADDTQGVEQGRRLLMTLRWIAAGLAMLTLIALLMWQEQRFAMVNACHDAGGWWDGATSRCRAVPPVVIERGLKRS